MSQVEYTAQDFELVGIKEDQTDVLSQKTTSFWGQVFHTFARNKLALFSVALLAVIALLAIFVPMFWPISFSDQSVEKKHPAQPVPTAFPNAWRAPGRR